MKVDIKTKAEIAQMREACRMSAEIRDICAAAVAPGVTTGEIDDLVVEYCKKHGFKNARIEHVYNMRTGQRGGNYLAIDL